MPTLVENSKFTVLWGDRSNRLKIDGPASRERTSIIDVTFGATENYVTGGLVFDFSKVKNFQRIYYVKPVKKSFAFESQYIPASDNLSSTGVMKFFDVTGLELSNANTGLQNQTMQVEVRGI